MVDQEPVGPPGVDPAPAPVGSNTPGEGPADRPYDLASDPGLHPPVESWAGRTRYVGPPISRLWWAAGPLLVLAVTVVVLLASLPMPYRMISPGSAWPVDELVEVTSSEGGPDVYPISPDGDLWFLTVSVRRPAGIEALYRVFDDQVDIVPEKLVIGTQSRGEAQRFNIALMTASKDKATLVALRRLGFDVEVETTGAVVVDMAPDAPVARALSPGDTITGLDGEPVDSAEALIELLTPLAPGTAVELTVDRLATGATETVTVELVSRPDDPDRAMLGVSVESRPTYDFPVQVDINSGSAGGPSAGLAFTLAIIDLMSDGDLVGAARVAVTGTMELDGTIGPVGGVRQKVATAIRNGAELLIVPPPEFETALDAAGGRIEVRSAADLDEALAILEAHGGDPVPAG